MTIIQRLKDIVNEIDDIRHPPTENITISKLEEKLMEYEGEPISITYSHEYNTSMGIRRLIRLQASSIHGTGHNPRRKVHSIQWNHGESRIVTRTPIRFIRPESNDRWERIEILYRELKAISPTFSGFFDIERTQPTLEIKIDDSPITAILGDFKKCAKIRTNNAPNNTTSSSSKR